MQPDPTVNPWTIAFPARQRGGPVIVARQHAPLARALPYRRAAGESPAATGAAKATSGRGWSVTLGNRGLGDVLLALGLVQALVQGTGDDDELLYRGSRPGLMRRCRLPLSTSFASGPHTIASSRSGHPTSCAFTAHPEEPHAWLDILDEERVEVHAALPMRYYLDTEQALGVRLPADRAPLPTFTAYEQLRPFHIVFVSATSWPNRKDYGATGFAHVADALTERLPAPWTFTVITSTDAESTPLDGIEILAGPDAVDCLDVFASAEVVIGNDTGLTHLAALTERPDGTSPQVIGLYGRHSHTKWTTGTGHHHAIATPFSQMLAAADRCPVRDHLNDAPVVAVSGPRRHPGRGHRRVRQRTPRLVVMILPGIGHHRRFTANHTWHIDWPGHPLFVKANPVAHEARAERAGHARLRGLYPVPDLRAARRVGRWTLLVYQRWPHLGHDSGLLLDEITRADRTTDTQRLDACLNAVLHHYQHVISHTLRYATTGATINKLYADRAAPGGRLDQYYQPNAPWPITTGNPRRVRPQNLADLRLVANGREHAIDFADLTRRLRRHFAGDTPVWAAITQGDPTDLNIGWSPAGGPVWFDYDTAGLNALAGEFACFLLYQRLHGAWLTPHYNPAAFRDHPSTLAPASLTEPAVHIEHRPPALAIDYRHTPTSARRHVMRRYLDEVVRPISDHLGIEDLMAWLRPYLMMRLLAVYHLADLEPRDTALSLALLAQALDPATGLRDFLALTPASAAPSDSTPSDPEVTRSWPVPSPSSPEPVPASEPPSPCASPIATT